MRFLKGVSATVVILAGAAAAGYGYWQHALNAPLSLDHPRSYEVHQGDGARATLARLQSEGIIASQWPYELQALVHRDWLRSLKVGEFRIDPSMNAHELVQRLSSNDVVTYRITVPEGRNFDTMRAEINNAPDLKHDTRDLSDEELMAAIGHAGEKPEGRFFPSTYRYTKGTSDKVIYHQAYDLMAKELGEVWQDRAGNLPYDDPYSALIMASLVEQEAASADERTQIAGVFTRRLEKGMRLQTDPSVVYGLDLQSGRDLTRKDLATDNPYNTYRNKGLPPTPISLPGRASLEAAVHPEEGDALYFVAMGNGHHVFSKTLQEHNAAVQRYVIERALASRQDLTRADRLERLLEVFDPECGGNDTHDAQVEGVACEAMKASLQLAGADTAAIPEKVSDDAIHVAQRLIGAQHPPSANDSVNESVVTLSRKLSTSAESSPLAAGLSHEAVTQATKLGKAHVPPQQSEASSHAQEAEHKGDKLSETAKRSAQLAARPQHEKGHHQLHTREHSHE